MITNIESNAEIDLSQEAVDSTVDQNESLEEETTKVIYAKELGIIKGLPAPKLDDITSHQVFLGETTKKYTLLLDLDETLVAFRSDSGKIKTQYEESSGIIVRPFAVSLIETLSAYYEIVIFTAASEEYANEVTEILDPDHKYITKVLTNCHCLYVNEFYVKDLRIIADRQLDQMLIVDNSIISFAFQLENGIPVTPYFGEADDQELDYLTTYLKALISAKNIVEKNKVNIGLIFNN